MARRPLRAALATGLLALVAGVAVATWQARAADFATLNVTVTTPSDNWCFFRNGVTTLSFGVLDPGAAIDVNASTTLQYFCAGKDRTALFFITRNDGLHSNGPGSLRMQHVTDVTQFLPYEMTLNPASGPLGSRQWRNLTINGVVRGPSYMFIAAGDYQDQVTLTIVP